MLTKAQMVFPGLVVVFVWFAPESPRWLYAHDRREEAIAVLVKWHGDGSPESAWVRLQIAEYEEFLNTEGSVSDIQETGMLRRGMLTGSANDRIESSGTTVLCSTVAAVVTASHAIVPLQSLHNGLATLS